VSRDGLVLERTEVYQQTWLKIIEGHVVHCICNNGEDGLVSLCDSDVRLIIDYFRPVLQTDSNVVEFGLLEQQNHSLKPYLIDFVDDNSPIDITRLDIKSGIISYGSVTGEAVIVKDLSADSLNEHFHNLSDSAMRSDDKVVFFAKNPELALLGLLDKYNPHCIGFVFQDCAIGAHLAVVLRERGIPAIKTKTSFFATPPAGIYTIDAKTPSLSPKERLIYEQN